MCYIGRGLILLSALLLASSFWAQTKDTAPEAIAEAVSAGADNANEAAIRSLLVAQVTAWNRGDLEGYMQGYWHTEELSFFSGTAKTTGWEKTLERYRRAYHSGKTAEKQATGVEMGQLSYTELQVEMLGEKAAYVRGRWQLKMKNGRTPHGVFTLVLRLLPEGWRIVHDHSSGG